MSEPIDYLKLMGLVRHSWKVITDSGGLQKEAYFGKKRCIVLMPDTGWREIVEVGWNELANEDTLVEKVLSDNNVAYPENLYGDGRAGEKIVNISVC